MNQTSKVSIDNKTQIILKNYSELNNEHFKKENTRAPIPIWHLNGGIHIYPHLEIDGYNHNMREIANQLARKLDATKKYKTHVLNQSSYAAEINGPWNVVLSIALLNQSDSDTNPEVFMYMIRRCSYYKKTYFCPFYKESRAESFLTKYPKMLSEIEKLVKEITSNVKIIDSFPTHDI